METLTETTEPQADKPAFMIDSESAAGWLLRKLGNIRAEQERIKRQADQRQAELRADYDGLIYQFGGQLEAWARQEAEARRRKTITLLDGTVAFRKTPARLKIADEEAAFVEARTACPDAVQTITKLDAATYRKWAEEQMNVNGGEVPAGCIWETEAEAFAVRFPQDEPCKDGLRKIV